MPKIFLSYRRDDSQDATGRLFDRLTAVFPRSEVFKDVDSMVLGAHFPTHLRAVLRETDVVLVVIGPQWVSTLKERVGDPVDYVRLEVELALDLGIPTVPVVVSQAPWPRSDELPERIKVLAELEGHAVRSDPYFHDDARRLIRRLGQLLDYPAMVAPAALSRDLLTGLLQAAQDWYNEVVEAKARIEGLTDPAEARRWDYVYVNTKRFLPRLLSIRKLLSATGETARLASAVDRFVQLLTYTVEDRSMEDCRPLLFGRGVPATTLVTDAQGMWTIYRQLQTISDEVTQLVASLDSSGRTA
jgi:hypothetical protein